MSTLSATNLKNASSGSNNVVLNSDGSTTVSNDLKFNSGYGSAAVAYGCRAWVNFNGTGTVAIRASGNVSSITDNGVGDYTVNFTTAMVDANFVTCGTAREDTASNTAGSGTLTGARFAQTSSATRVKTINTTTAGLLDSTDVYVAIFR